MSHKFLNSLDITGDIILTGLVDGRNIATDGSTQDSHIATSIAHGVSGNIVGTSDTQTLTNKTISTSNNTIIIDGSDITSGTLNDARISVSNITQHQDSIDHNSLSNYVTNEHLDWTLDQGSNNIHDNNINTSSVTQHQGSIDHNSLFNFVTNEHLDWTSDQGSNNIHQNNITSTSITQHQGSIDHGSITGLGDDDHTQYPLLVGRSGGQTITGGTLANNNLTLKSTSHSTKGFIKCQDPLIANNEGYTTSYALSVQRNSDYSYIEILNNAGANKGAFFGMEFNQFTLYNWQGGDIEFWVDPSPGAGSVKFTMKNNGQFRIHDLTNGVVKSNASGILSSEGTNTAFNKNFGTTSNTVLEGLHSTTSSGVHGVSGNIVGTTDAQTLTNKTIDFDSNTITNIDDTNIKSGAEINAFKIANGSVSNIEFQYLDGVTSSIQNQLNNKTENGTNVGLGISIFKEKDGTDLGFRKIRNSSTIKSTSINVTNCYEFEDNVNDSIGLEDGTIIGGVTYTIGKIGTKCAQFDGVSGTKINIGTLDVPNTSEFSISLWFNVTSFSDARLLSKAYGASTSQHYFALVIPSASGVGFRLSAGGIGTGTQITGSTGLSSGVWYHFVAWYNGSQYKIYLNGSEDASGSKSGAVPTSDSIYTSIGNQPSSGGGDRVFNGKIDQVVFWDKALTTQEISDLYNNGDGRDISYFIDDNISFQVVESALTLNNLDGILSVSKGGTGTTTFSSNKFLHGNGTSAIQSTKSIPSGDVVGTTDSQTITNKTINTSSNTLILNASDISSGTLSVSRGGTGTTTFSSNKFLHGDGTSAVQATKSIPSGDVVGTTDSQTLTNKIINTSSNTLTLNASDITSGTLSVSRGGTGVTTFSSNKFLHGNGTSTVQATKSIPSGDVVGTTDSQTITNKTINTSSNTLIINASDITSGTFSNNRISSSNVTQHEGSINHDNLLGFVINEHIDWTIDQDATNIHTNNIIKTLRQGHTWCISGQIKLPSGDTNFICPFFISLSNGQTIKLTSCRHVINSGTSVTAKLQKNDIDISGFTNITITTTETTTNPSDISLSENDKLSLIVTAVSGTPKNLSFTIFLEHII